MNRWFRHLVASTGALLALGLASGAQAQANWVFDKAVGSPGGCKYDNNNPTVKDKIECAGQNFVPDYMPNPQPYIPKLVIDAYSTTKGDPDSTNSPFQNDPKATVTAGQGLGVDNNNEPNADQTNPPPPPESSSVDNVTNTDALLFSFGSSMVLKSISVTSVPGYGTDVSILAWTGTGDFKPDDVIKNLTPAQLLQNGWTLVGSFAAGTNTPFNTQGIASSYWLVSAYNTNYGVPSSVNNSDQDVFKVFSLAGTTPEPGSLALVAAALAGAFGLKRRGRRPLAVQPSVA